MRASREGTRRVPAVPGAALAGSLVPSPACRRRRRHSRPFTAVVAVGAPVLFAFFVDSLALPPLQDMIQKKYLSLGKCSSLKNKKPIFRENIEFRTRGEY